MTDLHKPLGQNNAKPKSGALARVLPIASLGLLLVAGTFLYVQRSGDENVVVSLDESAQPKSVPSVSNTENNAPSTDETPAEPKVSTTPTQPTEPAEPQTPEPPSFKPKQTTLNKQKAWLPVPELVQKSQFGPLPVVASSGLRPLDAYSERPNGLGKVRIALVLGGMGISQTGTKSAIDKLPAGVTLAFSPIGNSLSRWMQLARKDGHEVALQIPMEPLGYPEIDPGRWTLLKKATLKENMKSLHSSLGRMTNYPFVMSYLGAGFTNDTEAFRPILAELKNRGLGWMDDGSVPASKSLDLAEELKLPNVAGNIIIDSRRQAGRIASQLQGLELLASRRGYAIGSGTAFPETVKAVSTWIKEAEKKGIQIVPVSSLMTDYSN